MPDLPPHLRAIAPEGAHVARPTAAGVGPGRSAGAGDGGVAREGGAGADGGSAVLADNAAQKTSAAVAMPHYRREFAVPKLAPVMVRDAAMADWADIWPFFRALLAAGETMCLPNVMMGSDARTLWFGGVDTEAIVAVDPRDTPMVGNPENPIVGKVVGSASMRTARDGHGNHVARMDVVVDPRWHGQGVEQELGITVLFRARAAGFRALEIDPVVEADTAAIETWQALGFEIVGTRPLAFDHPTAGSVGLHVMHREL